MKVSKIKKCPFCGGDPWINRDEKTNEIFVECRNCLATSHRVKVDNSKVFPVFPSYQEAARYVLFDWAKVIERESENG